MNDDERWWNVLIGKESASSDDVAREAGYLKKAIHNSLRVDNESDLKHHTDNLERLLFRLKQEGLLNETPKRKAPWFTEYRAIAASILILILAAPVAYHFISLKKEDLVYDGPAFRGGVNPQLLRADNAEVVATGMVNELLGIGVDAEVYLLEDFWMIEAATPKEAESREELGAFLNQYGLDLPAGNLLLIAIPARY